MVVLEEIHLVVDGPCFRNFFIGGMGGIDVEELDRFLSTVRAEFAVEHFGVIRRLAFTVKGVGGGVHSDESSSVLDPIHEEIDIWNGEGSGGVQEDDAIVFGEGGGVHFFTKQCFDCCVVGIGIVAGTSSASLVLRSILLWRRGEGELGISGAERREIDGEFTRSFGQFGNDFLARLDRAVSKSLGHAD